MANDASPTDLELEALMAELEAQNAEIAAANAPVAHEPAPSSVATANAEVSEGAPSAKPVVAEPETVAAHQDDAGSGEDELGEADLAELEAELEAADAAGNASVSVELPAVAVPAWEGEGEPDIMAAGALADTLADREGIVALVKDEDTGKLSTPGSVKVEVSIDAGAARAVIDKAIKENAAAIEERRPDGLRHYVDVGQFRSDTRVTEATLDSCMIEQNGLRAWYGALAAQAEAQASRVKAKFEVVEATLYDHHRKALALIGEKTTEKMVENAVKLDPRWLKGKNLLIEAETIAAINKGLVESLKDRRDMIIQLGADRRDEYKGAARVMAERNEREDLRERAIAAQRRAA